MSLRERHLFFFANVQKAVSFFSNISARHSFKSNRCLVQNRYAKQHSIKENKTIKTWLNKYSFKKYR